jgi:ribonuclease PH
VLRTVVDRRRLGERTVTVDCDVLTADGGTRTAAITGGQVALAEALARAADDGRCEREALTGLVAAVSVGIVDGQPRLDLDYREDSSADVDMNVAMTDADAFVEVQAAAEGRPFTPDELEAMLELARAGVGRLIEEQRKAIAAFGRKEGT